MKTTTTTAQTLWLHALSPVHAGTGQVSASVIDLPVAREKATNWPLIPATTLKGVLKDATPEDSRDALFGSPSNAGSLQFGDARLVCFPVRSWKGVFAYVTSPTALNRLTRDFGALGAPFPTIAEVPSMQETDASVTTGSALVEKSRIWLEDLDLTASESVETQAIAESIAAVFPEGERAAFIARFVIVSDDLFDFLTETATAVTARVSLEEASKTVKSGGLWYEESVPAEAIFVAPVLGRNESVLPTLPAVLQFGGNETVGQGLCRVTMVKR